MTPQELLAQVGKAFPGIWRTVDELRADRGTALPDWPPYVFLPVAGWYALACSLAGKERLDAGERGIMQGISCVGTWRPTQDIVRFDPDVYESLAKMGLPGDLPVEIFKRLPAWAVYVETPGLVHDGLPQEGFFAYLEQDVETGHEELRIFFNGPAAPFYPAILHLGPWDLKRACQESNAYGIAASLAQGEPVGHLRPLVPDAGLETALNLLLYICAYGLGDHEGWSATGRVTYPPQVKTKSGWRLFPPPKPSVHTLGASYGEQIRKGRHAARGGRPHSGPRPHVRRAHWHGYWIGPKTPRPGAPQERRFSLRWLPPIPVAMAEDESLED